MLPTTAQDLAPINLIGQGTGVTRIAKAVSILLITIYVFGFFYQPTSFLLSLVAGRTFGPPFLLFNIFTASFVEISILSLIYNLLLLNIISRTLEPIWGSLEFFRFILVIDVFAGVLSYWFSIFIYMITLDEHILFNYGWCGFSGIATGLLVALKHLNIDREIQIGSRTTNFKYFPSIVIAFEILPIMLGAPEAKAALPLLVFGTYGSWLYLRFFKFYPLRNQVGDLNPQFGLDSFFPEFLSPIVNWIGNLTYNTVGLTGLWKSFGPESSGSHDPSLSLSARSVDSADAKRRRARAALALDKRLEQDFNSKDKSSPSSSSDLVSIESSSSALSSPSSSDPPVTTP